MEIVSLFLCLSVLSSRALAGSPFMQYERITKQVEDGAKSVQIFWIQDMDYEPSFVNLEVNHTNPITSEQRNLGSMNDVTVDKVVEGYSINAEIKDNKKNITLTIDTVSPQDDGKIWLWTYADPNSKIKNGAIAEFTVIQSIKMLYLKLGEHDRISAKPTDPIELEPGTYPVNCSAEGSNPATTDVKLFLNGNEVTLQGTPVTSLMEGDLRKYRTIIIGNIKLPEMKATHEVECVARDTSGNTLSTRMDVSVAVTEKEEIKCDETTAEEGELSISLSCTVDHAKMNASGFSFEVGKTGEIIKPGDNKPDSSGTVSTESLSATKTKVTLTLPKAEGWHFESDFYLLIDTADGKVTKEPVKLEKKGDDDNDDGNAGNCLTPFFGLILCLVMTVSCQWF